MIDIKGITKSFGSLQVLKGIDLHIELFCGLLVTVWLIINELISILENVAALGGPVPVFLAKLLARLKNTVEKKAEGDEHGDT